MYCPKCGTRLEEDDEICPNCGASVSQNTPEQTEEPADDSEEEPEDFDTESDEEFEEEPEEEYADESAEEPEDSGEESEDKSAEEYEEEASAESEESAAESGTSAGTAEDAGAITYGEEPADESEMPWKEQENQKKEKNTRISRPVFVVLFIVVSLLSLYVLYTLWDDEGEEERAAGEDTIEAEADEEAAEGEEEEAGEEVEEDVNGEDIVIEQENPADDYELEAFEDSWAVIRQYGMDGSETYYRDFVESIYSYSDLSFTLKSDTFEDLDDYYFIEAAFNKPVMVPVDLKPGDTYTVDVDELRGTVLTLTCTGSSNDKDYLEDGTGQQYYCAESGYDRMANLYESSGERVDAPFYEGVLRIRLDAVTGDAMTHGPYSHVTETDFEDEDRWFDIVAFDEKGYVKQLIYDGD